MREEKDSQSERNDRGILSMLTYECESQRLQTGVLKLELKSVTKFVKAYNDCVHAGVITFANAKPKTMVHAGLIAGQNISLLKFREVNDSKNVSFSPDYAPMFGLYLTMRRRGGRLSFTSECSYIQNSYRGHGQYHPYSGQVQTSEVDFKTKHIKTGLGARINFDSKTLTSYVGFGVAR